MFENFSVQDLEARFIEWGESTIWSVDTLVQVVIIAIALKIGYFIRRVSTGGLTDKINNSSMPGKVKQVSRSLTKLIMPAAALIVIFIASIIGSAEAVAMQTNVLENVSKVLLAWIVIRILVQIIDNPSMRNVIATTIWIIAALSIFGVLEQTAETLDSFGFDVGEFRLSALVIIKGLISIFFLLYAAIFVSSFAERQVFQNKSLSRASQVLIAKVVRVVLIVFALLIGITSAGIDLSLFAVFGGAVGLGIGFGLQKGISNLFSGMLLLLDKSIKPGDVLELIDDGVFGWVNHMGARYTEIVTRDNKSFLVPNEDFITQKVVNWSHGSNLIRLEVKFGVDYSHNPHEIKKIAEEAAAKPDRVVKDPLPVCHLVEFGDSSLNFALRFWITDAQAGVTNIRGAVMLALWDAFELNGVKIPYPHREVFIHQPAAN